MILSVVYTSVADSMRVPFAASAEISPCLSEYYSMVWQKIQSQVVFLISLECAEIL